MMMLTYCACEQLKLQVVDHAVPLASRIEPVF